MRLAEITSPFIKGFQQAVPLLKLGTRRLLGRKSPFSMSLSLTNRCNFSCQFCELPKQHRAELATAEWFRIIDEFRSAGMCRVSLIGGEPMLHEDLGAIIRHLKRAGVHAAINTNGWFTIERLDDLRLLDLVCVSLDGPREVHDPQRHPGSYQRAVAGMEQLRRVGVKVVTMTVLTGFNREPIDHVLELAGSLGTLAFFQIEHDASADVSAPIAPQLSDQDIAGIARYLLEQKSRGLPVGNSRVLLERHIHEGRRIGGSCADCFAGRYMGYIFSDGTVAPCLLTQWTVEKENGRKLGYLEAFKQLARPSGPGCACMPIHEINAMLSLDPNVLLNAVELALGPRNNGIRRR